LLQADDVWLTYRGRGVGRRVADRFDPGAAGLHGISLEVPRHGLVGILGPNGSGKTTLLRVLAGVLRPSAGRVTLDGRDLHSLARSHIARRLAMVPQETHVAFDYSVLEVALMGRYPHLGAFELEGPRDLAIAREALAATGTGWLERRPFDTLSGGEKQRVVIASALAQAADVMLLDEPTASLDLGYQVEVASLVRRLNRERQMTVVIATHDLNFAAALCDRLVLLREGRVMASGKAAEVLTPDRIAELYGVEAEVRYHEAAGHVTVVPIRRVRGDEGTRGQGYDTRHGGGRHGYEG
jgi:iron complex transport system ATP-binding protein